jgi:hypothetical protein
MNKFSLGEVVATPGALEAMAATRQTPQEFLRRHVAGDWGDLDATDKVLNNEALVNGRRLLSAYRLNNGEKIWIITEAVDDDGQRACTTILLPDEY